MRNVLLLLISICISSALAGERRKDLIPLYIEFSDVPSSSLKGEPNSFIFVRNLGTKKIKFRRELEILINGKEYKGRLFKYIEGRKPIFNRNINPGELGVIGLNLGRGILENCSETEIRIDNLKTAQFGELVYQNDKRKVATFAKGVVVCENLPIRMQRKKISVSGI